MAFFEKLAKRAETDYTDIQKTVDIILEDIKTKGDLALFDYTKRFDGWDAEKSNIKVTEKEIEEAMALVSPRLISVMEKAAERIRVFHEKQMRSDIMTSENGETLGFLIRPLENVGVYVPGGKAAYPSSVLMNIVPAKVAGVKRIVMVTPVKSDGKVNPNVLAAAKIAGADDIYKIGGAQAVAALAFGTGIIPKVDKICGPGNIFVALAKKAVYGSVSIDSIAGPSEILILADDSARADFVAADMLSQAEHDEMASAVLITDSRELAEDVKKEIFDMTKKLCRKEIIEKSVSNYGAIVLVDNMANGIKLVNKMAPEHLEICTKDNETALKSIKNSGAVFLGNYSPEPLGDYMAGANHVLPTGGSARFFSPLCIDDFIKKMSVISFSKSALSGLKDDIELFADSEGLTAHANAVKIRFVENEFY
ncbi:MAG: histidinol dehydrogenase [Lachnospiraceae bacterium]|nr:histidinol dehydrogenase [Lachnospiraceae bacterium]